MPRYTDHAKLVVVGTRGRGGFRGLRLGSVYSFIIVRHPAVGLTLQPDKAAYSVTKHAALALAEWLAATYRPRGIKVSCFCPGPVDTPMFRADTLPADHPALSRIASPRQVATRLVDAIGAERFLIVDSERGPRALAARATDYDAWIDANQGTEI